MQDVRQIAGGFTEAAEDGMLSVGEQEVSVGGDVDEGEGVEDLFYFILIFIFRFFHQGKGGGGGRGLV